MEKQQITESNKIIAEFMGRCGKDKPYLYTFKGIESVLEDDIWYRIEESKFHLSWDWLMPVVQKCREEINKHDVIIKEMGSDNIIKGLFTVDLDFLYISVIKFIKWYNENK